MSDFGTTDTFRWLFPFGPKPPVYPEQPAAEYREPVVWSELRLMDETETLYIGNGALSVVYPKRKPEVCQGSLNVWPGVWLGR